jgi:hypothetical protein
MSRVLQDVRFLILVVATTTILVAFATDYLVREWLAFAVLGAGFLLMGGLVVPRRISLGSAIWAGTLFGAFVAWLAAMFRAV